MATTNINDWRQLNIVIIGGRIAGPASGIALRRPGLAIMLQFMNVKTT